MAKTPLRNGLISLAVLTLAVPGLCTPIGATAAPKPAVAALSAQARVDAFARDAGYRFAVLSNQDGMTATLTLTTPKTLPQGAWSIYLSIITEFDKVESDAFTLTRLNGDFYRLTPKAEIKPDTTYIIGLHARAHYFSEYYPMPNAYVLAEGAEARVLDATRPAVDRDSGLEVLPFVAPMTDEAAQGTNWSGDATKWLTPERAFDLNAERAVSQATPDIVIIPMPVAAKHLDGDVIDLGKGVNVSLTGTSDAEQKAALDALGVTRALSGVPVSIAVGGQDSQGMAPESYHLVAAGNRITITAPDDAGASYALRSLAQQAAFEKDRLKPIEITDAPRFTFRGMHLDLARNFQSKAHILAVIEQMADLKLNKLHLHLGDDEGWRVAIAGLPELTDIGSKRCADLSEETCLQPQLGAGPDGTSPRDGYLTRQDYIDILKAARARHIEVIPSFDMPGHSRAAVRSMEARARRLIAEGKPEEAAQFRLQDPDDTTVYSSVQSYNDNTLNICLPSTYAFINRVVDDIKSMHDEAGEPLKIYHIGTDETAGAWKDSPVCKTLMARENLTIEQLATRFITKVSKALGDRGIEPAGWSDGMGSADPAQMPAKVQSNSWGSFFGGGIADAYRQANYGWDIVMSTPDVLYFDMPWAPDPKERGYDWASRGTDLYKVFAFVPENLGANVSLMTDTQNHGHTVEDTLPLTGKGKITGIQGQLWSETIRSDAIADYMLYPRLQALAERAWHKAAWEPAYVAGKAYTYHDGSVDMKALNADWQGFNDRLSAQLPRLEASGAAWRLPPPGARVVAGFLQANVEYGNLDIDYQTGDKTWRRYSGTVAVTGPVRLRSVSPDGKRYSRIVTVNP